MGFNAIIICFPQIFVNLKLEGIKTYACVPF